MDMDMDSEDELIQYAKECHASAMALLTRLRGTEEEPVSFFFH